MPTRGNGLSAASYVPLRDLDPRVTDGALEALRVVGIAAYAVIASAHTGTGLDLIGTTYDRPVDRLYVDASARDVAAGVIDAAVGSAALDEPLDGDEPVLAGVAGASPADVPDLDAAFERIVAGFDRTDDDRAPIWPPAENAAEDVAREGDTSTPTSAAEPAAGALGPAGSTRDDLDHFVPPPPPPLPELDPVAKLAWAGIIGGPLILVASLFGVDLPQGLLIFAVLAFVAGFATMVARLKDHPDDADPDDGAVV